MRLDLTLVGGASRRPGPNTVVPGTYPCVAAILGELGLRYSAALRYGGGRGDVSPCHHAARAWTQTVECCLCAAFTSSEGRALWRKPQPAAALLPIPGDPETVAARYSGSLPQFAQSNRHRLKDPRHPFRGRRLGKPHARCLGPGLGVLV